MIELNGIAKIYLKPGVTDMRLGIDGLLGLVGDSAEDNCLYIFCGRNMKNIKILHIEPNGCWLYHRRNDYRRFMYPQDGDVADISGEELRWLIEGVKMIDRIEGRSEHPKYDLW